MLNKLIRSKNGRSLIEIVWLKFNYDKTWCLIREVMITINLVWANMHYRKNNQSLLWIFLSTKKTELNFYCLQTCGQGRREKYQALGRVVMGPLENLKAGYYLFSFIFASQTFYDFWGANQVAKSGDELFLLVGVGRQCLRRVPLCLSICIGLVTLAQILTLTLI